MADIKIINTDKAPAAIGPYSQALAIGNMMYLSGQIPVDPETGNIPETVEEQAAQSIENIKNILKENGMTISNVVKTTVFLSDINDFAAVNSVYGEHFQEPYPARSCVQVAAIPKGCKVEIECIAVK